MKRLGKEEINLLPLASWQGPIHLVTDSGGVEAAMRRLAGETLLGFDTETRPAFHKGQKFAPSLLQLAAGEAVWLFQLRATGLPEPLCRLLADPAVIKAGVAPEFDLQSLQVFAPLAPAGFVDLARMARQRGINNHGLRGLAAALCSVRISKSAQTTNWANPELTPQQLRYAATDAWMGRELYQRLLALPVQPRGK